MPNASLKSARASIVGMARAAFGMISRVRKPHTISPKFVPYVKTDKIVRFVIEHNVFKTKGKGQVTACKDKGGKNVKKASRWMAPKHVVVTIELPESAVGSEITILLNAARGSAAKSTGTGTGTILVLTTDPATPSPTGDGSITLLPVEDITPA